MNSGQQHFSFNSPQIRQEYDFDVDDEEDGMQLVNMPENKLRIHRALFDNPRQKQSKEPPSELRPPTLTDNSIPAILQINSQPVFKTSTPKILDISIPSQKSSPLKLEERKLQSNNEEQSEMRLLKKESVRSVKSKFQTYQSAVVPDHSSHLLRVMMRQRFIVNFIDNLRRWAYVMHNLSPLQTKLLEEEYVSKKGLLHRQNEKVTQQKQWGIPSLLNFQSFARNGPSKMVCSVPLFEPLSKWMLFWKAFRTLAQILIFIWIPFSFSFKVEINGDLKNGFISIFVIDQLISINQGYFHKGQVISNYYMQIVRQRRKIIQNYIYHSSLVESVSITCLILVFHYPQLQGIIVCILIYFFLSAKKVYSTVNGVQEFLQFKSTLNEIMSLFKLVVVIVLIAHVVACLWHFVGQQSLLQGNRSWISDQNLTFGSTRSLYNYSFYWATMTMVTVGYGDVSPQNDLEVLFATSTMFVTCGVFAFAINAIGLALSNIRDEKLKARKTMAIINEYMTLHQVEHELQGRVRNYLEYCLQKENEANDQEIQLIIDKLSSTLRNDLFQQIRGKALSQCRVFKKTFNEQTIELLLQCMETVRFSPEELIIREGVQDDCSIYIIQRGCVELELKGRALKKLHIGESFGERSFFTGFTRVCSIRAVGFVKLYKITQQSALQIITDPQEKEKWCSIRDNISLYEQYTPAKVQCYACGKSTHLLVSCPSLNYKPDLERILKKDMFRDGQDRMAFTRTSHKHSSWKLLRVQQERAKQFKQQYFTKSETSDVDEQSFTEETSKDKSDSEYPSSQMKSTSINNFEQQQLDNYLANGSNHLAASSNHDGTQVSILRDQIKEPSYLSNYSNQNILLEMDDEAEFPTRTNNAKQTLQTASFNAEGYQQDPLMPQQQQGQRYQQSSFKINLQTAGGDESPIRYHLRQPSSNRKEDVWIIPPNSSMLGLQDSQLLVSDTKRSTTNRNTFAYDEEQMIPKSQKTLNTRLPSQRETSYKPPRKHTKSKRRTKKHTYFDPNQIGLPQINEEGDTFMIEQFEHNDDINRIGHILRKQSSKAITAKRNSQQSLHRISSKLSTINPQRRQSTMTGTNFYPSAFNIPHNLTSLQTGYNHLVDLSEYHDDTVGTSEMIMDQLQTYKFYFPFNNVETVVKRFNRYIKQKLKIYSSKYTFYYVAIKRAHKIRRFFTKRFTK